MDETIRGSEYGEIGHESGLIYYALTTRETNRGFLDADIIPNIGATVSVLGFPKNSCILFLFILLKRATGKLETCLSMRVEIAYYTSTSIRRKKPPLFFQQLRNMRMLVIFRDPMRAGRACLDWVTRRREQWLASDYNERRFFDEAY